MTEQELMTVEEWQVTQARVKRMQEKYWFHVEHGTVYILHGGHTVAKASLEEAMRIMQHPPDTAWLNMTLPAEAIKS